MNKSIFLMLIAVVLFFGSCITTNKSFQSSPVVSRKVELDPIKADIKVDESKKLHGQSSIAYFLIFKIGKNNSFADGIEYSVDASHGFNPIASMRANVMNPIRSSAAYNALQQADAGDYDVLVHPTYETTRENYLFIYRKYTVKVSGYGAKYSNFRTEKQKVVITSSGKEYVFPDDDKNNDKTNKPE